MNRCFVIIYSNKERLIINYNDKKYKQLNNILKMDKYDIFTIDELISFGNYLLSDKRRKSISDNPEFAGELIEERASVVNDADLNNWEADQIEKDNE